MRIDKFLWAVRIFKTRSIAAEAVKTNKVLLGGANIKAAHIIKPGDELSVKKIPIWRKYKVKELLKNRVGAKLVDQYIEEITSPEELEKLEMMKLMPGFDRDRGTGRPTKKERRELENFTDDEIEY